MNAVQAKRHAAGRWLYLSIGTVGMLFSGVIYAWSILKAPLEEAFGWSGSALALNFTLTMCCFCIGGILASALRSRCRPHCPGRTANRQRWSATGRKW